MRHFALPDFNILSEYLVTFNILHMAWLLIFYCVGFYDTEWSTIPRKLGEKLVQSLSIISLVTIAFFYIFPFLNIRPKTILFFDLTISAVFLFALRVSLIHYSYNFSKMSILLCSDSSERHQLEELLDHHDYFGYEICMPPIVTNPNDPEHVQLRHLILDRLWRDDADILAVTRNVIDNPILREFAYQLLRTGVNVIEFSHLYEQLTGKIPVSVINEGWFLNSFQEFDKRGFEIAKRLCDVTTAFLLGIGILPIFLLVALAVKLDSLGPVLFRQQRMGKDGRVFEIIKIRTMVQDAERHGPQWAVKGDNRVTRLGGLLRKIRFDELPQLWNVLKGEMSLLGPRPERPEFVKELAQTIPFFEARHLVKPGLTGWAQINFRYGASVEEAKEKLQYDLFYIKNRSISLDLSILLKTVGTILRSEGH
jgi:exopolysaccharide biosynthesis polyprenyl glycosylphosphotransferase